MLHDLDYTWQVDKIEADNRFLDNGLTLASKVFLPLRPMADFVAFAFYLAVKHGGDAAYEQAYEDRYDDEMVFKKES